MDAVSAKPIGTDEEFWEELQRAEKRVLNESGRPVMSPDKEIEDCPFCRERSFINNGSGNNGLFSFCGQRFPWGRLTARQVNDSLSGEAQFGAELKRALVKDIFVDILGGGKQPILYCKIKMGEGKWFQTSFRSEEISSFIPLDYSRFG